MLPFARGIPSHGTLNDVLNALDPVLFSDCFVACHRQPREVAPDAGVTAETNLAGLKATVSHV